MGYLGKVVKGRAKRPDLVRAQVKVRNIDKSVEDLEKEQQLLKERRTKPSKRTRKNNSTDRNQS